MRFAFDLFCSQQQLVSTSKVSIIEFYEHRVLLRFDGHTSTILNLDREPNEHLHLCIYALLQVK